MKRSTYLLATMMIFVLVAWKVKSPDSIKIKYNLTVGSPEIKAMHKLAFGPDGILFIGDSKSASVFAVNIGDTETVNEAKSVSMIKIDLLIAESLGTTVDNITIQDMAVNPLSKSVYFAVHILDGSPVLLKLKDKNLTAVDLSEIEYSQTELVNAISEDAADRRGRPLRKWAISDLGYYKGNVLLSGLSNKEFSSTFRSIPFPFKDQQDFTSLEIYHAAHGQYETHSPTKTFTTAAIDGEDYLIASYTCTPLVLFPLKDLKSGTHVKGRTIGEFGNGSSPLDLITMSKEGKSYLIMANSSRPVMKVGFEDIKNYKESLTEPVKGSSETAGVKFVSFPLTNVLQLDKLDNTQFIMLQRKSDGNLNLLTRSTRWL